MTFGEKLRLKRTEKKLTQGQVAAALGITKRAYISYETSGVYPRSRETYCKLAEIFECDPDYLLTENEEFVMEASAQYGSRGKKQAEKLVKDFHGLCAGGELSEHDKDVVMAALQRIYFDCKLDNKKHTPKKYRKQEKSG